MRSAGRNNPKQGQRAADDASDRVANSVVNHHYDLDQRRKEDAVGTILRPSQVWSEYVDW